MSSRLPQELFDAILDKLAEPPHKYSDYYTSKDALAKASRSSRCLNSAAQANLWRNIWLLDPSVAEFWSIKAAAAVSKLGSRTTTLVYSSDEESIDGGPLDVAHVFPSIVDLHIICRILSPRFAVGLEFLSTHTKLRHLSLVSLVLDNVLSVNLPGLETLEMLNCLLSAGEAAVLLRPHVMPSLRVLSLIGNLDRGANTALDLRAVIAPSLLPQLDYATADVYGLDPESELGNGVVPPFLFDASWRHVTPLPRHSKPLYGDRPNPHYICLVLTTVANGLRRSTASAPFVVVLPRTVLEVAVEDERAAAAVRCLELSAQAHAARIMWVPEPPCWDSRARMEGEFRAYGRALRLAREAAA
ncbi:uncharacterized protein RHOBADRAFT_47023 [Rhodotorula graminis WP1]|uniref:F-box domain-containing protein n=1 Tax=Rhodotorula graminis (strain WP1) TaxID=578459 RepID=A0A0N8PZF5_RHOGW|nr:uncharacterized protein RHOBADRAFT_47023 [Rhodotorula graminis WP1]KPV72181.1 hypothetical protein RHOBADRAFT_47023 [Rhodotorula graminis WP1]